MKYVSLAVLLYVGVVNPVIANARLAEVYTAGRNFDYVATIEQVPEGQCRYVHDVPRPYSRLKYPEPPLLCRTNGVVYLSYLQEYVRTDEPK